MSESLKSQVIAELNFHQQEVDRLTRVLALLEDIGVPSTTQGSTLKMYKRRVQPQSAKDAISKFQQAKHAKARAEKAETEETNLCGPVGV